MIQFPTPDGRLIILGRPKFHLGQLVTFSVHTHSPLITCQQHKRETGRECQRQGEINMFTVWRRAEMYGYRIVEGKQWHWIGEEDITPLTRDEAKIANLKEMYGTQIQKGRHSAQSVQAGQ